MQQASEACSPEQWCQQSARFRGSRIRSRRGVMSGASGNDEGQDRVCMLGGCTKSKDRSGVFRHVAPGVFGLRAFRFQAFRQTRGRASSSTRAKQAMMTEFAPAFLSAFTHAVLVAPLVRTSSTSRMSRPFTNAGRLTEIAPANALARAFAPIPPRLGVRRVRTNPSTSSLP